MASEYPKYGDTIEVECRIAWPQLGLSEADMEKRASKRKGKAKTYKDKRNSLVALIRKKDKATLKTIMNACMEVGDYESLDDVKWPMVNAEKDMNDGDDERYEESEGYAGCYFFKTGSNKDIDMVYLDKEGEIVEVDEDDASKIFYPGSNCVLILQVCEWEEGEITFYLQGIMRLDAEGKRFGGDSSTNNKKLFQKYASKKTTDSEDEEEEEESSKKSSKTTATKKTPKGKKLDEDEIEDDEEEQEEVVAEVKKKRAEKKDRKASINNILD